MSVNEHRSFFGMPSLGGKLTLVNANLWIVLLLLIRGGAFTQETPAYVSILISILMLILAFPFGIFVLLPSLGYRVVGIGEIVGSAALFGVNAFVWGYGLAWCYERVRRFFGKQPPHRDANG